MQKLTITIALAVIALALGTTTITTTMQIKPAYSQATHCVTTPESSSCVTPGKNPSITINSDGPFPIDGKTAGERIGTFHSVCGQSAVVTCTVTPP